MWIVSSSFFLFQKNGLRTKEMERRFCRIVMIKNEFLTTKFTKKLTTKNAKEKNYMSAFQFEFFSFSEKWFENEGKWNADFVGLL